MIIFFYSTLYFLFGRGSSLKDNTMGDGGGDSTRGH